MNPKKKQVQSKSNHSDENEDDNNFEKLQKQIKKLHDDLVTQYKNAKSFSQSIRKEFAAGPATLSNATCLQLGQASQASDGLQAAATSVQQACPSATTKISAQQTWASPQQNSWQIPPAESQEGGTNTISSTIPNENESGKEEQYEYGDEDEP